MHVTLMLLFIAFVLPVQAADDFDRQQIIERIQPIGNVHIEGKSGVTKSSLVEPVGSQPVVKKKPGQATYESHCVVCHQDGTAGAPKFRDASDWQPRLARSNLEQLTAIAIKGLNVMPPKGTCSECSEEDIKNAIQYMLPRK